MGLEKNSFYLDLKLTYSSNNFLKQKLYLMLKSSFRVIGNKQKNIEKCFIFCLNYVKEKWKNYINSEFWNLSTSSHHLIKFIETYIENYILTY